MSVGAPARRPPLWRDVRVLRVVSQVLFVVAVVALVLYLRALLLGNMRQQGISTSFSFLDRSAGFNITGSDFRPSQPVSEAIRVGVKNTVLVSVVGVALSSVIGLVVGVARLSTNWLVRRMAAFYVETLRNIPPAIVILFWGTAVILKLPRIRESAEWAGAVVVSNSGLWLPWLQGRTGMGAYWIVLAAGGLLAGGVARWRTRRFDATGEPHHRVLWGLAVFAGVAAAGFAATGGPLELTLPDREGLRVDGGIRVLPEYAAVLFGLTLYTASHIAEIVRGSILAVPRGQTESADALGMTGLQRLRHVILPQAFRILVPPTANQYLNLTKNSSLAIFVGYAELFVITRVIIGNGNPAPQSIAVMMLVYLGLSLVISGITNLVNRRLQLPGR